MYALLNLSTCIITILIALLPAIVHPTSGDESLFYPDSEPLGPLPDDNVGAADASYTNQDSMTDVLAFAPPNRENPDVSFQAPTDSIGMDALNPDPLNSLDSPLLLAAEEDWDWDCPEGKQSYCCSEGRINPLIPTHYGGCRNLRNREVRDKTCHPELRACCTSVHFPTSEGLGCVDVVVASSWLQWPDFDLGGFVGNAEGLGIGLWQLIHEKA